MCSACSKGNVCSSESRTAADAHLVSPRRVVHHTRPSATAIAMLQLTSRMEHPPNSTCIPSTRFTKVTPGKKIIPSGAEKFRYKSLFLVDFLLLPQEHGQRAPGTLIGERTFRHSDYDVEKANSDCMVNMVCALDRVNPSGYH